MLENVLALSFDCPVSPEIDFVGEDNQPLPCTSWGFGWYSGYEGATAILNGGSETIQEKISQTLNDWKRFHSSTFFCRFSHDKIETNPKNMQPFSRVFGGREWLWMTLGNIQRTHRESDSSFTESLGTSGSEEAFCTLLDRLTADEQRSFSDVSWKGLARFFSENPVYENAQIYVTDGQYLVVFRGNKCEEDAFIHRFVPPHQHPDITTPFFELDIDNELDVHRSLSLVTNTPIEGGERRSLAPGGMVVLRRSANVWEHQVSEAPATSYDLSQIERFAARTQPSVSYQPSQPITTNIRSIVRAQDGSLLGFRRLKFIHRTEYKYARPVRKSTHHFKMSPVEDEVQEVESSSISFSIPTAPIFYEDTFGNRGIHITIDEPYRELTIVSEATVRIYALPSDDLSSPLRRVQIPMLWMPWQRQMMQAYLLTPELPESQHWELNQYAMSFVERNDYELLDTLDDINRTIFTEFRYQSGLTNLNTSPYDVYANRRGVCQDFANLFICLARILNVPARYRMGYIYTGGNYENKEQADASHAWVEVYLPYLGWRGFDPTNGCTIKQDHIRVACGRNYMDATPTSGTIYRGGGKEEMKIEVKVTEGSDDET